MRRLRIWWATHPLVNRFYQWKWDWRGKLYTTGHTYRIRRLSINIKRGRKRGWRINWRKLP